MKIVVVGYGEMFRSIISGILKTQHEIVGVFRQENILYSPIKKFINDVLRPTDDYNFVKTHQLKEIKARSVNSKEFQMAIKTLKVDVVIVASWSEKISMQTINIPKKGCINVHPSLLPRFRGPNPYAQVILNAEEKTGVTFHLMDVNYDTGSILHQVEVPINSTDTGKSLKHKCCDIARQEVSILLDNLKEKINNQQSQDEKKATYQNQLTLLDSILNFEEETAEEIDRRIRGLTAWMQCHICYKTEFFEFSNYKICPKSSKKRPATIVKKTKNSLFIVCKDGSVIEFSSVKVKRPVLKYFTEFYLEKIVKTNERAI